MQIKTTESESSSELTNWASLIADRVVLRYSKTRPKQRRDNVSDAWMNFEGV